MLAAGVMLLAIIVLGKAARNVLRDADRYQLPFAAMDCPAPPGLDRAAFLGEVRYAGQLPETVSVLDDTLPPRLRDAFARHPWVARVESVEVGPGRRVRVALTFRVPVMAVVADGGTRTVRAVDAAGVLLPRGAATLDLPHLRAGPATGAAGKPWGDPRVEAAAAVAGHLHPHQPQLRLSEFRYEGDQLRLRRGAAGNAPEVIWGARDQGPTPARKVERLLELANRLDEPGGPVIDLRQE